ncbi:MAG: hypothetical protein ACXQS8_03070, partial [Candidatus Helarchaeales archaeon]
KEGSDVCQSTCTFFASYPNKHPVILSGDGIVQIDYAGELLIFGEPRSNVMKAYYETYGSYPEIIMDGEKADEKLIEFHQKNPDIGYQFPVIDLKKYEKVFPGLTVEEGEQCMDGCSGMLDYSLQMNIALGLHEYPRPCKNKIRIISGKPTNPTPKRDDEILIAHGDCAIKACKKAKIKPDIKFAGCPVSPIASILINFLMPGFPHTDDIRSTYLQYAPMLVFDDITNTWKTWKQVFGLLMNGRNLVSMLNLMKRIATFKTRFLL